MFVRDKISFKRGWFDRFSFQRWKERKKKRAKENALEIKSGKFE